MRHLHPAGTPSPLRPLRPSAAGRDSSPPLHPDAERVAAVAYPGLFLIGAACVCGYILWMVLAGEAAR